MPHPFEISFSFPLENSTETIRVTAVAQLHHSTPYYIIDSFHFEDGRRDADSISLLPSVEIERVEKDGKILWVHKDSQRTSLLSLAIGRAIEKSGHFES